MLEWLRHLPPRSDLEATLRVIRATHDFLDLSWDGDTVAELETWLAFLLEGASLPDEYWPRCLPDQPTLWVTERLYLTADGGEIVTENDPRQAFVYASPGHEIPVEPMYHGKRLFLPKHLHEEAMALMRTHEQDCQAITEEIYKIRDALR